MGVSRSAGLASGVVGFEPDELVVHVRAGTTMVELAAILAARAQRVRIPAVGTVGGAIAARRNGPYAADNAALPNIALRIRAVDGTGRAFTAGGATVKNVSGFDLVKLLVGSRGTLATITEVTLRTEPVPRASRWFVGHGSTAALYRPSVVARLGDRTFVNLEGHPDDVMEQSLLLGGFTECETPDAAQMMELVPVDRLGTPSVGPDVDATHRIARRLKEFFDPENSLAPQASVEMGLV